MHPIVFLPVLIAVIIVISSCTASKGNILILEDGHGTGFTMDFNKYSLENKCKLLLDKGDVLQIEVEKEDGAVSFTVRGKNGSEPYEGNELQTGMFTVTVTETDEYEFRIKGKAATGKITVKNLEPDEE